MSDHATLIRELEAGLQHFSDAYKIGWHVPITGNYSPDDDLRSRRAQDILGIPKSKVGGYSLEQVIEWFKHPSEYWSVPGKPIQNALRYARHRLALARFRRLHPKSPYVFPVDGPLREGRTDRGVDLETTPGALIRAIGAGRITAAPPGSAISSLGQLVLQLDTPFHGRRYVFIFHLDNHRVSEGQRVKAGQILAQSSRRPPGAEDMPGHIEYGFALDANGDIDQNVGADHYSPTGQAMHDLLHVLAPSKIGPRVIRG